MRVSAFTVNYQSTFGSFTPVAREYCSVFVKNDVLIRIKVIKRTTGVPYATRAEAEECWDIMAVNPTDN